MYKKWPYLKKFLYDNRFLALGAFGASLISNVLTVLIPVSIGKYYNLVFGFESSKSAVLNIFPDSFWTTVPRFITFFLVLVLLKIIAGYLEKYLTGVLGEKLSFRIRNQLFEHQLKMNMREYDEKGIGTEGLWVAGRKVN